MARIHNDSVAAVIAAVDDAIKASDGAEGKTAAVAHFVNVLLGDADRYGEVVPHITWAQSPAAMGQVLSKLNVLLGLDAATVRKETKDRDAMIAAKVINASRAKAQVLRRAVQLLGAFAILAERSDFNAEYVDSGKWMVPVAWFVSDDYDVVVTPKNPTPRVAFTSKGSKVTVLVMSTKGEHAGTPTAIGINPSIAATITAAYGKTGGRKAGQGAQEAKPEHSDGVTLETACDYVAKVAAQQDYGSTFSGVAADHLANAIAGMVRNESLWQLIQAERAEYVKELDKAEKVAA